VALLFGLLFAVVGALGFRSSRRRVRTGQRTTAEVVDMQRSRGLATTDAQGFTRVNDTFTPVVAFRTADGREIQAPTRVGGNPSSARVGEQVPVIYDPAAPESVEIDTIMGRGTALLGIVTLVGLGVMALGVYQMVR
jgi:hypothetical protein